MFAVNSGTVMPSSYVWKILQISGSLSTLLESRKPKKELIEETTSSNNKIIDIIFFPNIY